MKRLNQNGFGLVIGIVVVVVIAAASLVAWQIMKKGSTPPNKSTSPQTSQSDNDCGVERQCFLEAYNDECTEKRVNVINYTVEGDSFVTKAKIINGPEGCLVEVTVDGSQDKFGDDKVHTYTCKKLDQDNQVLAASECTGTTQASSVTI